MQRSTRTAIPPKNAIAGLLDDEAAVLADPLFIDDVNILTAAVGAGLYGLLVHHGIDGVVVHIVRCPSGIINLAIAIFISSFVFLLLWKSPTRTNMVLKKRIVGSGDYSLS